MKYDLAVMGLGMLVAIPVFVVADLQNWGPWAIFIAVTALTCIVAGIGWHSPLYRRWH
jgi:O-antigen/teichoic acid export membrane protein